MDTEKFADLYLYFQSETFLLNFSPMQIGGMKQLDPFCTIHVNQEHMCRLRFFNQKLSPHDNLDQAICLLAKHFQLTSPAVNSSEGASFQLVAPIQSGRKDGGDASSYKS